MLKETDFQWKVRRANNIPTNPIECEYCIVDHGDGCGRMYTFSNPGSSAISCRVIPASRGTTIYVSAS